MVKLIVFEEIFAGLTPQANHMMFGQLAKAYDVDELQMIRNWEDAEIPPDHKLVIVEQNGLEEIETFVHPENAVYVIGRTSLNIHTLISHDCNAGECVQIDTPKFSSLFGISAAAIVLSRR